MRACLQNKLFYTWLRVAELRNIQAAKRIVAQRRRQKLKLARLLRPQVPLLASWEPLAKPHADATADLGRVLSAACTSVPLAADARADMDALHETMFSCVGTVNEIEAITDMFYATVRTLHYTHKRIMKALHGRCELRSSRSPTLICLSSKYYRPARRAARWASSRGRSSRRWSAWRKRRGCRASSPACRWVPGRSREMDVST